MEKYPVTIGLHGFWGKPEDWNEVQDHFPHLFVAKDLYENLDWLSLPIDEAAKQWGLHWQRKYPDGVILAGYSMGGRFALHVARHFPLWVRGLCLMSTHPGGLSKDEKTARLRWIEDWQKAFTQNSLTKAKELWQSQETFRKTNAAPFRQDLSGAILALNLEKWSLIEHRVDFDNLNEIASMQIWLFGEDDAKFQKVSQKLQLKWPNKKVINLKDAGHRLLLDAPDKVAAALKELVELNKERRLEREIEIH